MVPSRIAHRIKLTCICSCTRRTFKLGAIAFRTELVREAGGFDPALRLSEDSDLLTRLAARYLVVPVKFVGSLFRQRLPSMNDAEARWPAHRAWLQSNRKLRQLGALPPLHKRLRADWRIRGMTAYYFCCDAKLALHENDRRKALRYIALALRVSPGHAVTAQPFWVTVATLIGTRQPLRYQSGQ